MVLQHVDPRIQPGLPDRNEAVEGAREIAKLRGHPCDDFDNGLMPCIQILPMQDAFVMEDTVPKIADVLPAFIELGEILVRRGSVGKRILGKIGASAGAGMAIIEEAGPETEGEFSHDSSRGERFPSFSQSFFGFYYLLLLPSGEPCRRRIIPRIRAAAGGEVPMHRIAQGDFRELQSRVEGFAECHVQQVTGKRAGVIRPILPVGVDALRVENAFDLLEKHRIHEQRSLWDASLISANQSSAGKMPTLP